MESSEQKSFGRIRVQRGEQGGLHLLVGPPRQPIDWVFFGLIVLVLTWGATAAPSIYAELRSVPPAAPAFVVVFALFGLVAALILGAWCLVVLWRVLGREEFEVTDRELLLTSSLLILRHARRLPFNDIRDVGLAEQRTRRYGNRRWVEFRCGDAVVRSHSLFTSDEARYLDAGPLEAIRRELARRRAEAAGPFRV